MRMWEFQHGFCGRKIKFVWSTCGGVLHCCHLVVQSVIIIY